MSASRTALAALLLLACSACGPKTSGTVSEATTATAPPPSAEEPAREEPAKEEPAKEQPAAADASTEGATGESTATTTDGSASPEPGTAARSKKEHACPGIDGAVSALILSEDRAATAKAQGLMWKGDRVRLIAELTAEDAAIQGPAEEELRAGTNAQVLVEPDAICALAATDTVKRVRKPLMVSPK